MFLDTVDDLIARRSATPTFDPATGESSFTYNVTFAEGDLSCTQTRRVHYVDAEGVRLRMQLSIDRGLLGVSLFAFGYETDAVFADITEINATLATTIPDGGTTPTTTAAPATTAAAVATTAPPATTSAATTTVATTLAPTTTQG